MTPKPDAEALFRRWLPFVYRLARKWARTIPNQRDVDDLAGEFARVAWQRFPKFDPARGAFSTWLSQVAWSHSAYLRTRAGRQCRSAPTASGTDSRGRCWLDRLPDARQLEPLEVLADGDGDD